jgi:outer membrane protein OmpA-like peptidoglycan-associated protein
MIMKRPLLFLLFTILLHVSSVAQQYDTLIFYFHVDSDRPITGHSYTSYTKPRESIVTVIRLEAHCDTTGALDYNDALAERRIAAVRELLVEDGWSCTNAREKIYSERKASIDNQYTHEQYRRVDVYLKIAPPTNAQRLQMRLNEFSNSSEDSASIDLTILFHGGSTAWLNESVAEAKALRDFMLSNPNINADIHGHVCCGDNYPLSYGRAKFIAEFLVKQGVSPERLQFEGHSNRQPKVFPELNAADQKQNRRVNVVFKKTTK